MNVTVEAVSLILAIIATVLSAIVAVISVMLSIQRLPAKAGRLFVRLKVV
jgi:hypothetical protein